MGLVLFALGAIIGYAAALMLGLTNG